jgi:hypothetical protein
MKNNTKHNAAKINTTLGKLQNANDFKEAFEEEVGKYIPIITTLANRLNPKYCIEIQTTFLL